jgi:hypothetical protein
MYGSRLQGDAYSVAGGTTRTVSLAKSSGCSSQPSKGVFGFNSLKFNPHYINVSLNTWSNKCRLIICMSSQIRSNLRGESIKPN